MAAPVIESFTWTNVDKGEEGDVVGPSTCNVDDLLLCVYLYEEAMTATCGSATCSVTTIPTGWTELQAGVDKSIGTDDASVFAYWKLAVTADTTSLPITYRWVSDSGADGCAGIFRISGVDTTTPIADDTVTTNNSGDTVTSIDLASVTTAEDDSLLLAFVGVDDSVNQSPYYAEPPVTSWTSWHQTSSTPQNVGKRDTYIGAAATTQASAGASGTKTFNHDVETRDNGGFLFAISPPAGGGGGSTPVGAQTMMVV